MKKAKKIIMWSIIATLAIIIAILGYFLYKKNNEVELASRNLYNSNFYELINYVQNVYKHKGINGKLSEFLPII